MAPPASLTDSGGVIAAVVIILLVVIAVGGELTEFCVVVSALSWNILASVVHTTFPLAST